MSQDSVVNILRSSDLATGWTIRYSKSGRSKTLHLSKLSRLALGSTQPSIQWVPVSVSVG